MKLTWRCSSLVHLCVSLEEQACRNPLHLPLRAAVVVVGVGGERSDLSHLNCFGGFEILALGCFDCLLL